MSRLFAALRRLFRPRPLAGPPLPPGIVRRQLLGYTHRASRLRRYHLPLRLLLRTDSSSWAKQTFLVDTEAAHTYIPAALARNMQLRYRTDRPCALVTRTGTTPDGGYLSPLTFALADLPHLQFDTIACFSRVAPSGEIPLLAGSDLLRHFVLVVNAQPTPREPDGYLLLHLRDDHGGRPRSPAAGGA